MKKFINEPADVLADALRGVAAAHPRLRVDHENRVIFRAEGPRRGKVGLVSGGGSGHEPLHGGFVGPGMLDAAACGALQDAVPLRPHRRRHGRAVQLRLLPQRRGRQRPVQSLINAAAAAGAGRSKETAPRHALRQAQAKLPRRARSSSRRRGQALPRAGSLQAGCRPCLPRPAAAPPHPARRLTPPSRP